MDTLHVGKNFPNVLLLLLQKQSIFYFKIYINLLLYNK